MKGKLAKHIQDSKTIPEKDKQLYFFLINTLPAKKLKELADTVNYTPIATKYIEQKRVQRHEEENQKFLGEIEDLVRDSFVEHEEQERDKEIAKIDI
jgi:hypothetical protein